MTNNTPNQPTGMIWRLKDAVCKSLEPTKECEKEALPPGRVLWNSLWFKDKRPLRIKKIKGQCCKCASRMGNGFCAVIDRFVRRKQTQCGQLKPKR
jgi:hypothetical protein